MRITPTASTDNFTWISDSGVSLISSKGGSAGVLVNSRIVTGYIGATTQLSAGVGGQCAFDIYLDAEL